MLLALALGAALLAPRQDPVRVEATLSSSRITVGETTVLVISVDTEGPSPSEVPVPVLPPGLELGPISDYSQLQVSFPGGRRRITRREIVLSARVPGQYRIPSVEVEVSGTRYRTAPLELRVVPGSGPPTPSPGADEPVQLRAWARPDTVWAGAQVLYEAEALFPEELRMRQARAPVFEPPASTGFWVYDLPDAVAVTLRIIGGVAYEAQTFRQVLFPLTPGDYQLPPARMQYEVRQGFAFTPVRREVHTRPVTVHARPLPPAPAGYAGAVGSFRVGAELSRARVAPGEPVTLRFIVEGAGNVKALPRPSLPEIPGAEVHVGTEDTRFGFASGVVSGRRVLEWTVVPQEPGTLEIPSIAYTWFDPGVGEYRTTRTDPLQLEARAGGAAGGAGTLAPLRARSDVAPLGWTRSRAFGVAQTVPVIVLVLVILAGRRRGSRVPGGESADPDALEEAARLLEQPRACLDVLARYTAGHSSPRAPALRDRIRQARYAPDPPTKGDCEALLAEVRRLDGGSTARGHVLPLLLLAGLLQGAQSDRAEFQEGVRAFAAAEYDVASRAFARHLRSTPRDAAGWYDLGNTWHLRQEPGRAAWAWLRALQLRPRDAYARHNLTVTGADRALELAPAVPLSSDELRLLAAAAWWALVALTALHLRSRRRRTLLPLLAALLLLLPATGVLAARKLSAPRALTLYEAPLRPAPVRQVEQLAMLPAGDPITILEHRGDWVLVRAHDLREGWIERQALGRL